MIKGFREFIMRGNVVDLAVAVVIGAAFGAVIKAFVANIITPIIAAIFGQPDFSAPDVHDQRQQVPLRAFINAVISFVLIAAAIYFVVVVPMNKLAERRARGRRRGPDDQAVPGVPQRDPAQGAQVRLLRLRAARRGGGRAGGLSAAPHSGEAGASIGGSRQARPPVVVSGLARRSAGEPARPRRSDVPAATGPRRPPGGDVLGGLRVRQHAGARRERDVRARARASTSTTSRRTTRRRSTSWGCPAEPASGGSTCRRCCLRCSPTTRSSASSVTGVRARRPARAARAAARVRRGPLRLLAPLGPVPRGARRGAAGAGRQAPAARLHRGRRGAGAAGARRSTATSPRTSPAPGRACCARSRPAPRSASTPCATSGRCRLATASCSPASPSSATCSCTRRCCSTRR